MDKPNLSPVGRNHILKSHAKIGLPGDGRAQAKMCPRSCAISKSMNSRAYMNRKNMLFSALADD